MLDTYLKAKLTGARFTHLDLHCSGSFGLDQDIMKRLGLEEFEKILIVNMNTGARFETYLINEAAGSNRFALYGGAARLGMVGDPFLMMAFTQMTPEERRSFQPTVLNLADDR